MDDDLGPLLIDSIDAIHRQNTRRPIHCMNCVGVYFMRADDYFKHRARHHTHPTKGGVTRG